MSPPHNGQAECSRQRHGSTNFMLTPWTCQFISCRLKTHTHKTNAQVNNSPINQSINQLTDQKTNICHKPADTNKFTSKSEYTPTTKSLKKAAPENFTWVYH